MSTFVRLGKKAKQLAKRILKPTKQPVLSYCRRIERVKTTERICAMTFDDGPMLLPATTEGADDRGLTALLLDILEEFDAKGTFDVIGDTAENYPDICGKVGTPQWGGVAYDHYPCFGNDQAGGALRCSELLARMIREGHQITNHSYRHLLFGKKSVVYGSRKTFGSFTAVVEDLTRLDNLLKAEGYRIRMARPPHYVDRIDGDFTAYDAYAAMGYLYLAASFDGAGWLPGRGENPKQAELAEMVQPMQEKLAQNPDFFCGQIIFQKDGYNMALRTPVAEGLREQLALLTQAGYRIVTVDELLQQSPFADIGREDADFDRFKDLLSVRPIAYSDNTLRPDKPMTVGELAMLLSPRTAAVDERLSQLKAGNRRFRDPYSGAMAWCARQGLLGNLRSSAPVTAELLQTLPQYFNADAAVQGALTRRAVYTAVKPETLQ